MHELLGEFAGYTPHALVRLIADGAAIAFRFMPNVVGVVGYALAVGWMLDALVSQLTKILIHLRLRSAARTKDVSLATPQAKLGSYFPLMLEYVLRAWIGIPVLYVLSLILSDDAGAADEFSRLLSGYSWQETVLPMIPFHTWLNFSHSSYLQLTISGIVAFLYLNNVYVYNGNGFEFRRKMLAANEALGAVAGIGSPGASPQQIADRLHGQGWSDEAVGSALWFLFYRNMRLTPKGTAMEKLSSRHYGFYKVANALGTVLILKALHPMVAALKVYLEKNDISRVREAFALYRKHLTRLPEPIRVQLQP